MVLWRYAHNTLTITGWGELAIYGLAIYIYELVKVRARKYD